MKNKALLLLVALLIAVCCVFTACGNDIVSIDFDAPAQTSYDVGDTLNLDGGKVIVTYRNGTQQEVTLTQDMFTSLPDMSKAGTYTVSKEFTPRTNAPYNDATKASTTIKKNSKVAVIGVYTNAYNNKWYKFTYTLDARRRKVI